jgi:hypothetical protein
MITPRTQRAATNQRMAERRTPQGVDLLREVVHLLLPEAVREAPQVKLAALSIFSRADADWITTRLRQLIGKMDLAAIGAAIGFAQPGRLQLAAVGVGTGAVYRNGGPEADKLSLPQVLHMAQSNTNGGGFLRALGGFAKSEFGQALIAEAAMRASASMQENMLRQQAEEARQQSLKTPRGRLAEAQSVGEEFVQCMNMISGRLGNPKGGEFQHRATELYAAIAEFMGRWEPTQEQILFGSNGPNAGTWIGRPPESAKQLGYWYLKFATKSNLQPSGRTAQVLGELGTLRALPGDGTQDPYGVVQPDYAGHLSKALLELRELRELYAGIVAWEERGGSLAPLTDRVMTLASRSGSILENASRQWTRAEELVRGLAAGEKIGALIEASEFRRIWARLNPVTGSGSSDADQTTALANLIPVTFDQRRLDRFPSSQNLRTEIALAPLDEIGLGETVSRWVSQFCIVADWCVDVANYLKTKNGQDDFMPAVRAALAPMSTIMQATSSIIPLERAGDSAGVQEISWADPDSGAHYVSALQASEGMGVLRRGFQVILKLDFLKVVPTAVQLIEQHPNIRSSSPPLAEWQNELRAITYDLLGELPNDLPYGTVGDDARRAIVAFLKQIGVTENFTTSDEGMAILEASRRLEIAVDRLVTVADGIVSEARARGVSVDARRTQIGPSPSVPVLAPSTLDDAAESLRAFALRIQDARDLVISRLGEAGANDFVREKGDGRTDDKAFVLRVDDWLRKIGPTLETLGEAGTPDTSPADDILGQSLAQTRAHLAVSCEALFSAEDFERLKAQLPPALPRTGS